MTAGRLREGVAFLVGAVLLAVGAATGFFTLVISISLNGTEFTGKSLAIVIGVLAASIGLIIVGHALMRSRDDDPSGSPPKKLQA